MLQNILLFPKMWSFFKHPWWAASRPTGMATPAQEGGASLATVLSAREMRAAWLVSGLRRSFNSDGLFSFLMATIPEIFQIRTTSRFWFWRADDTEQNQRGWTHVAWIRNISGVFSVMYLALADRCSPSSSPHVVTALSPAPLCMGTPHPLQAWFPTALMTFTLHTFPLYFDYLLSPLEWMPTP